MEIGIVPLDDVANVEKTLPASYISKNGFAITDECRRYLKPLIQGEAYPPYKNGIPAYKRFDKTIIEKKLSTTFEV